MITATFAATVADAFFPIQLLYTGKHQGATITMQVSQLALMRGILPTIGQFRTPPLVVHIVALFNSHISTMNH